MKYPLNLNQSKCTDYRCNLTDSNNLKRSYCESVKFHWLLQWKVTDLTVENIVFIDWSVKINWFNIAKYFSTYESVERQITDSVSENLTDSD